MRFNKLIPIKAEEVIKEGYHIGIHPEGTRTLHGKMNPLKKGGFHMAYNTKTPIVPIGCIGTFEFKPKNRWTLSPRTIDVVIGPIIDINQYDIKNIDKLIDKTWNEMNNLLK